MLKLQNISLKVNNNKNESLEILKDIKLNFQDNKLYVITGPNGGGKSSLAKLIMGIYKPSSGQVFFNDQDITDLNITERAQLGIGYAFQQPPRFKGIKIRELLQMAAGENIDTIKICDLLFDVGLCSQDYLDREVDAGLSGGELKRIEIATVLARTLKLAVFDEPEAGIDLWSFHKLAETFRSIHEKYQTTIIIISHQERILQLADEVILIAEGKVKEITTKEKILANIVKEDSDCRCKQNCEKGVGQDVECIG